MILFQGCGAVAQLGERRVRNAKVGSSILLRSTNTQRLTVLGWAFSFARGPRHAGFGPVLRVPGPFAKKPKMAQFDSGLLSVL